MKRNHNSRSGWYFHPRIGFNQDGYGWPSTSPDSGRNPYLFYIPELICEDCGEADPEPEGDPR